jgi:hypothetical protein
MSTSNDGTVRVWSLEGDALAVVSVPPGRDGQPPFVYRSVALGGGSDGVEVAAVGEEPATFVWKGQVHMTIAVALTICIVCCCAVATASVT